jgi:dolichol-phosphate mannosyltransferase
MSTRTTKTRTVNPTELGYEELPVIDAVDLLELVVVMPVYNEEASLPGCLRSWVEVLERSGIDYELLVINDGSKDRSGDVLADLAKHPRIRGISKANEGHGPTILGGYLSGVERAEWVFQVDSDDEIPASAFPAMWAARNGVDAVLGVRTGREQSGGRLAISKVARFTVRALYGKGIADVNVPFRLMRSEVLAPIVAKIPRDTFAPNVVISGALARSGARIAQVSVPHQERQAGQVSIVGWGALKAAGRSFLQSVRLARKV